MDELDLGLNPESYVRVEKVGKIDKIYFFNWIHYYDPAGKKYSERKKSGKWMYFFYDKNEGFEEQVDNICKNTVKNGIVFECKYTNPNSMKQHGNYRNGVACFYLNCDDFERHKKVIKYFLDNDLIQRNKNGKYSNISFKLDSQTRQGEYGNDFKSTIKLDDFIDLYTGEWKV